MAIIPIIVSFGIISNLWTTLVNRNVQYPYLDEVFHVGQVSKYLKGNYTYWDPKITTPPGLYIISKIISIVTKSTSTTSLRFSNLIAIWFILWISYRILNNRGPAILKRSSIQLHTAFNIVLFPPLFFFSALYYTDVVSVASVLSFWHYFISTHVQSSLKSHHQVVAVLLGILALCFRQTNIFWVSLFPIILISLKYVDHQVSNGQDDDLQVNQARLKDYVYYIWRLPQKAIQILQQVISGNLQIFKLIPLLLPYLVILATFGSFVLWNGGVVLGDKSNHIATIHLPQMLYIWPYIMFFSFIFSLPLIIKISKIRSITTISKYCLSRLWFVVLFIITTITIVRYNTIIHPFTLADNRHYMFYIFRYSIRSEMVRYLLVPIYFICMFMTIQCFGISYTTSNTNASRSNEKDNKKMTLGISDASSGESPRISYVLTWIIICTLQLVSAPLVEPRYFILPWIMWRLYIPIRPSHDFQNKKNILKKSIIQEYIIDYDYRLWLETIWFLIINIVTGYIFLYKGFEWIQEPGQIQRFIW